MTNRKLSVQKYYGAGIAGNFSLHHHIQTSHRTHPASYPMDTEGYFPGDKVA
jgi:hypothetical protein